MSEREYEPGERLEMTEDAYDVGLDGRCGKPCFGRFSRLSRGGRLVVTREGMTTPEYYHPAFWKLAGPPREPCPHCGGSGLVPTESTDRDGAE